MTTAVWVTVAGVAAGVWTQPTIGAQLLLFALPAGLAAIYVRRHPALATTGTFVVAACAGWTTAAWNAHDGEGLRATSERFPRCYLTGRVLEHHGGLGTSLAIDSSDCGDTSGVAITNPLDLPAGEKIEIHGWLSPLGDEEFDRARGHTGADAEVIVESISALGIRGAPHATAAHFRASLRASADHLSSDRQGLILGMTVGDTSQVPEDLTQQLRRAGLTHLLAVSGSNVAIVLGIVALLLRRLSLVVRVASAGVALALYLLIVGPEPSVLRAGAMGAIALLALWRGAQPQTLNLLGLALIVVILVRPGIVHSPGLHLSAAATAGIVLWAEPLANRFSRLPRPVALALGATLAAQFAVSPVLLGTFGEISVISPLANVLAFPVVAPITVLGLAAGLIGLVWEAPASLLMSALSPLAGWVAEVGRTMGGQSWASATIPETWAWAAAALVIFCAIRTVRAPGDLLVTDPRDDASMGEWLWKLLDASGNELRTTERFETKEEAEAWLGGAWQDLAEEGADSVALVQGDKTAYTMSLQEG